MNGWAVYQYIHVIPENDIRDHERSDKCKCNPDVRVVNDHNIITHNAFDGREAVEKAQEILNNG